MSLSQKLEDFRQCIAQCSHLIELAHNKQNLLEKLDIEQITVAAFLNLFIGWETFLEETLTEFMVGAVTLNGSTPVKYVSPQNIEAAKKIIKGVNTYFSYGNHANVITIVELYFEDGYPFKPTFASISTYLSQLRIMRNSSAHTDTNTQTKLENITLPILGKHVPQITLYKFLLSNLPKEKNITVYEKYKNILEAAATSIVTG